MKTKKNFLKKLTAGILGFVMTLGVGAAGYAASAAETKADTQASNSNWTEVTSLSGLNTTDLYTIATNDGSKFLNESLSKGHFSTTSFSSTAPTNTAAGVFKLISKGTDTYAIQSVNSSKYVTATGTKSGSGSMATSDSFGWKFSYNSGFDAIYQESGKGANLRSYGDSSFRTYNGTNNGDTFKMYKYYVAPAKTLSSIAVSELHRSFTVGDTFVKETVTATYSDSSTADVTNSATFSSPNMSTAGTKTISVSYTEGGTTKSTSYDITVTAPRTISSIEITSDFTKKAYKDNEDWDPAGLAVTAYYSSGTPASEVLTSDKYTLSYNPAKPNSTSIKSVKVTATLKTDSSKTDELEITGITVTAAPLSKTFDATKQGYTNQQTIESWSSSPISIDFDKNTGNNSPMYYTSGTAVRTYAGNKITVSVSGNYNIVEITFTFGSGDGENTITASTGEFSSNVWTGESNSVAFTIGGSSGNRRVQAMEIKYAQGVVHYPVSVAASFATEKGTYYNGSTNASKLSFTDVVGTFTLDNGETQPVTTINKIEIFEDSTLKGTLSSSSDKYSFEGATVSNSWSLKITCNGVAQGGGNLTSGALTITLNQVEASSYEWKSDAAQPTTEFYSHFDTYSLGGTLYATFNDGSHASQGSGHTRVDVIHEDSETGTVIQSIPSHTDGTINVTQNKTYWIESYFSQNADEGEHLFTKVSVKMPTMTVINGDAAGTKYYTNVSFEPNPNITVMKGSTQVTGLDADDFNVSLFVGGQQVSNPYTPTTTDTITVKVSLLKDSGVYGSYTVTPVVSTKTLTSLVISNKTYTAGDLFKFGAQDILVNYIENEVPGSEYITASSVTFTHSGETLDSSTRLLKNMNGWTINATYSIGDGEGKTVSTSFVVTVSDKQISPYTPGQSTNVKITSLSNFIDGDYVILVELPGENGTTIYKGFPNNVESNKVDPVDLTVTNGVIQGDLSNLKWAIDMVNEQTGEATLYSANLTKYLVGNASGTNLSFVESIASTQTSYLSTANKGSFKFVGSGSRGLAFRSADSSTTYNQWGGYAASNIKADQNQYYGFELYRITSSPDVGNKIDFLKSIIDSIRLNQEKYTQTNLKTELRAHEEWTRASGYLSTLTSAEWNSLNVADAFGPSGSTYKSVYELAFACSVSFNGTHVSSNGASSCAPGAAYSATLTVNQGYQLTKENISITMGGSSFTDFSYENGSLEISAGKITGDLVITAEATVINYTITYNVDGGAVSSPNPETYNVETAATTLNPAIKTGHQFLGWFTENGKTTGEWGSEVTQIGGGATGDLVLYAKYSVENYTVTFLGTNVTSDGAENCDYGETYTATLSVQGQFHLPGSISVKCGDNDVSCNYSNSTGELSFTMPAGNVTITANASSDWSISYSEVDGTAITGDYLINSYQEGVGATLVNAHDKTGYVFTGWYDNTQLTGSPVTVISTQDTGPKTFYAKWTYAGQDALDCVSTNLGVSYTYSKDGGDPVVSKAPTGYHYEKATSLAVGDTVALVCEGAGYELSGISTTSTKYGIGVSTTEGVVDGAMPLEVVAGSETGTFAFKTGDNYLRWNSGNSLDSVATSVAKNSSWNVTIKDGNASISNANDATRIIWWNVGSPRFACYADKSDGKDYNYVQLYKLVSDTPTPPPGPTYDSTFKFNVKNTGLSSLISMYSGAYDDMGIAVSYTDSNNNDRVRYFSFIADKNGKFWVKEAEKDPIEFKFNKDGTSFALNLGDVLNNIDVANIEFTVQAYIYEGGVYHLSENKTTMSLMDWIDGYYAIPKYKAAVEEIHDLLHSLMEE